jgi:hypothetical protein
MWSRLEGLAIELATVSFIFGVEVSRGDRRADVGSAEELRRGEARCPVQGSASDEVRDWP